MFLLFGSSVFWTYAGRESSAAIAALPWSAGIATRLLRCGTPVAAASGLAWLLATLATMTGGFAGTLDPGFLRLFFFDTPFGPVELTRLALLAGLVAAPFCRERRRFAVTAVLSASLLVTQAWLGHAAEGGDTPYGWLMVASYAVHVLAGGAWVGGLPMLLVALAERRRDANQLALLLRFSAMASVAASAVAISGAANTAFRVGPNVDALTVTLYGRILLIKLGIVAITLGLAALTRFVVMARLRRACGQPGSAHRRAAERPSLALGVELGFGLLVLGAAAVLGITAPPR